MNKRLSVLKSFGEVYHYVNESEKFYKRNLGLLWEFFILIQLFKFKGYSFKQKTNVLIERRDSQGEFLRFIHQPKHQAFLHFYKNNKNVLKVFHKPDYSEETIRSLASVCSEIFAEDLYKINKLIKNKDIVMDIGANIGIFSLAVKERYPNTQIIAFEPEKDNFQQLKRNLNKYTKINLNNVAVGESVAKKMLRTSESNLVNSIEDTSDFDSNPNYQSAQMVSVINIDKYIKINADVMKLDIEGYESFALKGAKKTIKKNSPLIIISADHSRMQKKNIIILMKDIDKSYKYIDLGNSILCFYKKKKHGDRIKKL